MGKSLELECRGCRQKFLANLTRDRVYPQFCPKCRGPAVYRERVRWDYEPEYRKTWRNAPPQESNWE